MTRLASIVARTPTATAKVVGAAVFGAAVLAGCTASSTPAPTPTSATSGASPSTTSGSAPTTSTSVQPPRVSTLARYDVTTLVGSNIYDFPLGRPGPHNGVLLPQMVGTSPISVAGATGPVSMYLPCCRDSAHQVLDYQLGSTRPVDPTQIPIADNQGIVLDGRLVAIVGIVPVGSQPRVQAQVIVFPASAATGLPVVK